MISKDLEYMKRLEENVFPYLIMSAKDIREIGDEDRTREALVRMRIADYLVDLGCVAGDNGGKTVIAGDPKKVISSPKSSWYFINKMIPNDN